MKPVACTRAQFLNVVRETDTIPALYRDSKDLYQKTGLRATICTNLPEGQVEAILWADGLCVLSPDFFNLLEAASR